MLRYTMSSYYHLFCLYLFFELLFPKSDARKVSKFCLLFTIQIGTLTTQPIRNTKFNNKWCHSIQCHHINLCFAYTFSLKYYFANRTREKHLAYFHFLIWRSYSGLEVIWEPTRCLQIVFPFKIILLLDILNTHRMILFWPETNGNSKP